MGYARVAGRQTEGERDMKLFTKRYHPPGTSPGTLATAVGAMPPVIRLIDYGADEFSERPDVSVADCRWSLQLPTVTWIHVQGRMGPEEVRELGQGFGLHLLALEDVINQGQRAKLETYGDQLFVVAHLPFEDADEVRTEQVSLFLGDGFLVSFCEADDAAFEPVLQR
jgi:magnesium transporter